MKMAVYGYTRAQGREPSIFLAEQERQITAYAARNNLELASIYHETGSAGVPIEMREHGAALFAQLRRGDILIIAKLDRLIRHIGDAVKLMKRFQCDGIGLHAVDMDGDVVTNPATELARTVLAACAAFEEARSKEFVEAHPQEPEEDCWEARLREEDC
jgi:DNA invertase Pin-like site-specific DNA recombinase